VQIARRDIDRNQILAKRARVEAFPNPTMGPAYFYTIPQTISGQMFYFNVTFDIPTWNRNQGNIRATKSDVADAVASLGTLQNGLLRQADDALGRYRAARQTEERYRTQILPTARRSAELVRDAYQKGVLDISTYLTAQRELTDALSEYVEALETVWAAGAEIAGLLQAERFP
jgi:cobalt-zinc-cadmium efflux system outer membrane protein